MRRKQFEVDMVEFDRRKEEIRKALEDCRFPTSDPNIERGRVIRLNMQRLGPIERFKFWWKMRQERKQARGRPLGW